MFTEFHRVLAPGGHLLLAFFQADDDAEVLAQPFDHKVTTGYRWSLDGAAELLRKAGFTESARLSREPNEEAVPARPPPRTQTGRLTLSAGRRLRVRAGREGEAASQRGLLAPAPLRAASMKA